MANTSATGGTLVETTTAFNVEHFFHDLIMGLTELTNTLIRPRWQPNAPIIPTNTVDWVAFGVSEVTPDGTAFMTETTTAGKLIRHEFYSVVCSFYGPNARNNCHKVRDGLEIGQNRETLFANRMGYKNASKMTHAPELINDIWFDRYDTTFEFAREVIKLYNILDIASVNGVTHTESISIPFNT